jgi:hypothetical protein
MSRQFRSRSDRAMEAEGRADAFRRQMCEAKAPTTWRLMRAVNDALVDLPYGHPMLTQFEELSLRLCGDAEAGAERGAADVAYVSELLAKAKENA